MVHNVLLSWFMWTGRYFEGQSIEIIHFLSISSSVWVNLWLLARDSGRNWWLGMRFHRVVHGTSNRCAASRTEVISWFFIACIASKILPS
jgi:hypothetical protein